MPSEAVAAETDRVVQEFRRRARLPGFRKGKVPVDLVRKRYHDEIEREVVERLVPRYWRQAQAETEIEPLLAPEIGDVEFEPGASLTFSAIVDLRPAVELGDIDSFELPDPPVQPEEAEVDKAVDDLRRQAGEWKAVDRPAARGDRVKGTLVELTDETEGEPNEVAFEVGDPSIWEELSLAVSGAKTGAENRFERREEGAEATRTFRIRVDEVAERELPPLDDETAAKIGDFASLAELRERVAEELERRKRAERRRQREEAMLDQLCERHPLEVPQGAIEQETEMMVREYAEQLARRGVDVERAGLDWQRIGAEMGPQAQRRVHTRLLLDAVAEEREIEVSPSELEGQLALLARSQGADPTALRRQLDADGRLDELRRRFLRGKAVDYLLGNRPSDESAETDAPEAREEE